MSVKKTVKKVAKKVAAEVKETAGEVREDLKPWAADMNQRAEDNFAEMDQGQKSATVIAIFILGAAVGAFLTWVIASAFGG